MRTRAGQWAVFAAAAALFSAAALVLPAAAAGGNALQFTDYNGKVTVPDSPSLRIPTNVTIEVRVKLTQPINEFHHIASKGTWELGIERAPSGGYRASFGFAADGWKLVKTDALAAGQWYTIAATYDGAAMRLFVDGMFQAATPVTGNIAQDSSALWFGMLYGGLYWEDVFSGILDEARISNVVRYTSNYNVSSTPFTSDANTAGLWHFDEGSGTTVADASANHNNGTVTSAATWTTDNFFAAPDTTAPTISNVAVSTVTATTAAVTWTTDEASSSQVRFGITTAYGSTTTKDDVRVKAHGRALTGLAPNTAYHVQAVSTDKFGNERAGGDVTFTTGPPASSAAVSGQWSPVQNWPLVAVHSVQLYTGEILMWDAWEVPSHPYVYNPTSGTFTEIPNPYGLFCSGHALLTDGRVAVFGGHAAGAGITGINTVFIFDPATRTWTRAPDMAYARWYPSATTLSDGRVVVLSGNIDPATWATTPEIYDPATNSVSRLTGVSTADMRNTNYPLSFLLPGGKVFVMSTQQSFSRMLDVNAKSYTPSAAIPLNVNSGAAAQYLPGKILLTGGGDVYNAGPSGNGAAVIDLASGTPQFRAIASMQENRYQHNMTVLADGSVFIAGGSSTINEYDRNGTYIPEIWDPNTEVFTPVPPMANLRMYHSTSMLLPDGRVLVAGGGRLPPAIDYPTAEIYSPPYLFKGPRPTITTAPGSLAYGSTFTVDSPDAASIAKVSLHRLGSITHTLDQGQHYVPMTFSANGTQLSVTAPNDKGAAPAGYYMLTIVDSAGVPSVSKIVRLSGAVAPDTQPPTSQLTAPASGATVSGTVPLTASLSDNVGVVSAQYLLDGNNLGPAVTAAPWSSSWDTTGVANGSHQLMVQARDAAGNSSNSPPVTVTVANAAPDITPPTISAVQATGVIATGATITWTTDEAADSQVEYGLDTGYGQATTRNPALTPNHTVTITGLTANTTYHYRVISRDAALNQSVSGDFTFTTPAPEFTLICNLTNPTNGSTVSGTIDVTASVTASNGAAGVQFKVDGANLGAEDTTAPYSVSWNTTTVANGSHTVSAVVRDTVGNTAASDVSTVTVSNTAPPPVGLVGAWGFNEASGTVVGDSSGGGNDGSVASGTRTTGKSGGAISFNGTSTLVTVTDRPALNPTSAVTVEAWVKPSVVTKWMSLAMKEEQSSFNMTYGMYASNGASRPGAYLQAGGSKYSAGTSSTKLTANSWTHLAMTYDGTTLKLYQNGVLKQSTAASGAMKASTRAFVIGGNTIYGEYFKGVIDEVRLYNRALSASEITTDMNTPI